MINTTKFWKAALIRAVKTFLQTFVAMASTTTFITEVQWKHVISASALAAILSLATSIIGGLPEVKEKDD